jgi:hypothetical protein
MPPPPPVIERETSKVTVFDELTARTGGPFVESTAANPTTTVVEPLAKVTAPVLHWIEDEPLVSIVWEAPSDVMT